MMKDRRYGGSSRLRSLSPRRRGFSPPRRSRVVESGYSSPRGRLFDADEDKGEGRYSRKDEYKYRRNEDINRDYKQPDRVHERKYGRGDHHQGPSRGGTRLSDYDDAGGRDRDRDVEVGHMKRFYLPTASDGDRGRSLGRGGMGLSGYDASGGRDRDRDTDMEADQLKLLYQPTASDGDRGRSFGRGGTRLSGYEASGGRDKDRDTEVDYSRLYQPLASDGDRGRSYGSGGMRLSGYDASGGRDRYRDTKTDYPQKMYQPDGYGEDSQRTYKYGDVSSRFPLDDLRSSNGSKNNTGQWPEGSGARNEADYDYRTNKFVDDNRAGYGLDTRSNKFVDNNHTGYGLDTRSNKFGNQAGYGLDTNPVPVKAEKGRFFSSSSYQMDMGPPPKSSSQVVAIGDGLSQSLSSSLHKNENLFINGRQHLDKLASDRPIATYPWSEARGAYREDNLPHYRPDIDMIQSSSRSKASDVVPSGNVKADREDNLSLHYRPDIDTMQPSSRSKASDVVPSRSVKADIISSSRDFLPPAEVKLSSGSFNYTGGYNEYGSKSRAKSPVDHDGRSADLRNNSLSYLGSTKERFTDYAYPTGGQVERVGMGSRSRETYGKSVDVVEDKYVPRGVPSIGTLEPIIGNAEGSSDQGYLRGNRLLETHTMSLGPRPADYHDTHKLVETSRQEVKSHHYGSRRSPRGNGSYLDHGVSRLGELNTDRQDGISWSSYKQTERLPPREYGLVLDNFEHGQGKFISDKETLPKPLKRTFEQRGDTEKEVHRYGGTWNDLVDASEPWRDDLDSKYRLSKLKYAKSNFGNANNVSNLSSQDHFHGKGSVSGPSHYSNISGHKDIKKRLGPVTQKLHVSQRLVNKYKPSLKKRLGPGPQNNDTIPPWLRKRKAPNSRRIQDSLDGGFADQGGDPQEDDVTQTRTQEDDVTRTKLEPPENSEDFKQMVSNAFLKFVKQLNETPAKRRKYMEHIDTGSLKCIVCGSVSEEFGDTESLVLHAFTSQKVGVRSQHLGLHKALCALMGWKTAELHEATWICESLSRAEHSSIREDLIVWPPVVIVHNSTIGNQDKDKQVIVSVQELEENLREMGFGEKVKVHRGKPANQSVMVVQFSATFSGLQEAERLHKIYSEAKHGRDDFQLVNDAAAASASASASASGGNNGDQTSAGGGNNSDQAAAAAAAGNNGGDQASGGGGNNGGDQASGAGVNNGGDQAGGGGGGGKNGGDQEGEPSSIGSKKIQDMMYGYMGIAEDMHQLDFDTKRRCLVKSKRDIQDIAQAPLKGYK